MTSSVASMPDPRYADHRRYLLVLAVLFAVLWTALAIAPKYREDWALENALVVALGEDEIARMLDGGAR